MKNIDWSKAPEGATHFDTADSRTKSFMKLEDGAWYFWPPMSDCPEWSFWCADSVDSDTGPFVARPPAALVWNGEGLPPVGAVCEAKMPPRGLQIQGQEWVWRKVEVVKSGMAGAESECLVFDVENTAPAWVDEFRPILTPERIAAEERDAALTDIALLMGKDPDRPRIREMAAILYDAGYRKQVNHDL